MLHPPVELMRLEAVTTIPALREALWQPKVDGWRCAAFVGMRGRVEIQARSGRVVTGQFPELAPTLAELPHGTVLDGELAAFRDGENGPVLDFLGLRRTPARRRMLGIGVQLLAFDLLCQDGTDVRSLPLSERWPRLLTVLDGAPAAVQPIVSTEDRAQGEAWARALIPRGFEGLVAKRLSAPYGEPRSWFKQRHADTVDADLLDSVGVRMLRVRLESGRVAVTEPLAPRQLHELAEVLAERGESAPPLRVEVRVGAGRHGQVVFVRARPEA